MYSLRLQYKMLIKKKKKKKRWKEFTARISYLSPFHIWTIDINNSSPETESEVVRRGEVRFLAQLSTRGPSMKNQDSNIRRAEARR
jgi:hypothetical protein